MSIPDQIPCWIYASPTQAEMYLYLAQEDGFDCVPEPLRRRFGAPRLVMRLELDAGRRLARVDVARVLEGLRGQGYYLQLPPEIQPVLFDAEY